MMRKAYVQFRRKISECERIIDVINEALRENPGCTTHDLVRVTADHGLAISKSIAHGTYPTRYGVGCIKADKILSTDPLSAGLPYSYVHWC